MVAHAVGGKHPTLSWHHCNSRDTSKHCSRPSISHFSFTNNKTDRVLIVRDEGTDMKLGNTQLATVDEAKKAVSTERGDGKGGGNNGTSVLTQKVAVRGQQTTARKTSPFRSQLAKLDEADKDANSPECILSTRYRTDMTIQVQG